MQGQKTPRRHVKQAQSGYTIIEIAIAVTVLVFLAGILYYGFLNFRNDQKFNAALIQLESKFPQAIITQASRSECSSSSMTKTALIARGAPQRTVWNTDWTVSATSNEVTINYTIESNDQNTSQDLATSLGKSNNIESVSSTASTVSAVYRCN